LDVVNKNKTER